MGEKGESTLAAQAITLDRDLFLRRLVHELSGTLEEVIGIEEASGFISIVGQHIAEWLDSEYRAVLGVKVLNTDQLPEVLVDIKRRIQGDFYIIQRDEEKIVLGNRACPFAEHVRGRSSLCMMTSTVLGTITAENSGYAKVTLEETIAQGATGCRVVIRLKDNPKTREVEGNEYYRA